MVKIIPVESLNEKLLEKHFFSVIKAISELFFVISVTCNNHVVNRNLFKHLCGGGELKPFIDHPIVEGRRLYMISDPSHNIKNAFNNWTHKKIFRYPAGFEDLFDENGAADFRHVKALFSKEEEKPLRVAHLLNSASLNPSSISRTSPRHALAVFSESTLRGLQFYDNCKWSITGQFVSFILNLWKVLNIQTPVKGKHKNDPLQDPLTHHDRRFQMLHRAAELLSSWEKSGRAGMTKETTLAWTQTLRAISYLSEDLIENFNFDFVLTGKLTSDVIEARFGCYRQMSGANFLISVRQLVDSERKLRVLNRLSDVKAIFASDSAIL